MRFFGVCLLLLGVAGTPAHADLIDPAEAICSKAKQGAECTDMDGRKGTCQPAQCCRNDYSMGVPPSTVCSDCLKCKQGAPPATITPKPKPKPETPAAEKPKAAEPSPEKAEAAKPAPPPTMTKDGCAAAAAAGSPWGSVSLALGLLLTLGLARSRRRRR